MIDLNADVGEECGDDASLLAVVTSANVATGAHAGGGAVLDETVREAVLRGCAVGAHPSYRDRENFGRVSRAAEMPRIDLIEDLVAQVLDVVDACRRHGTTMRHVKPHGALYHDAATERDIATVLVEAVQVVTAHLGSTGPALVGPPDSVLEERAASAGLAYVREGFADRAYASSGALVPRSVRGSVHTDDVTVVAQALALAQGLPIGTSTGATIVIDVDSLCLHGDTPGAVEHARAVRGALEGIGVTIRAPWTHE
jgi:UPF0271 protein